MLRLAINGFGRIGRNAFKIAFEKKNLSVVAINDLTDAATLAHLLKHDSNYGTYERSVKVVGRELLVDGATTAVLSEKDPTKLPWKAMKVDMVLECTGLFTSKESASAHLAAGAKRVIISAPAKGEDVPVMVIGVNAKRSRVTVISNASCTTNCLTPVMAVMEDAFGIAKAMMTTIHAYTADQRLQDSPHNDLRRARTAQLNIIPTTTGAAIATTQVIPALKGKFDGLSMRVPVSVVSLSDCTLLLKRSTTVEEVNSALERASRQKRYHGILAFTREPLVSSDFIKHPASAIVDLPLTMVVDGNLVKVVAWYDNEWGYSNRLVELACSIV